MAASHLTPSRWQPRRGPTRLLRVLRCTAAFQSTRSQRFAQLLQHTFTSPTFSTVKEILVILAFSVAPSGGGNEQADGSVSPAVAQAVKIVRESGLPYRTSS